MSVAKLKSSVAKPAGSLAGLAAVLLVLLLAVPSLVGAQTVPFKIPIAMHNNGAGTTLGVDTLVLGFHPSATYCIDAETLKGFIDGGSIKEYELPPTGFPDIFDARFVDPRGFNDLCLGQGVKFNIHDFADTTQKDTFQINIIIGSGGYPLTLRWQSDLSKYCDSMRMKDALGGLLGLNVNMTTVDSVRITTTFISQILIYVYGPKDPPVPPPTPALVSPSSGAVDVSLTPALTWLPSVTATGYRVQVSTSPGFGSFIYNDVTSLTSVTLPELTQLTTYYWRVSATNAYGSSAYQTTPPSFTTTTLVPATPVLVLPADGATGVATPTTFRWRRAARSTTYQLQVSTQQNFSSTVFDSSGISDTSAVVGVLQNCRMYYWRVRGKNTDGDGAYATPFSCDIVNTTPAVPVLSAPADNATNQPAQPTLTWTGDLCSDSFRVQVSLDPAFGAGNLLVNRTTSSTSMQVGPLSGDTVYYWQVLAFNPNFSSAYAVARSFRTALFPPSLPVLVTPADGANLSATSPTFTWTASTNKPAYYILQIDTVTTFANPIIVDSSMTEPTAIEGPLYNCDTYYWRVRSVNSAGRSAFTAHRSFSIDRAIPQSPQLLLPASGATGVDENPLLSWKGDICTNDFMLQVSKDTLFGSFVVNTTTAATSTQIGPLESATKYFWRVYSRNELGSSAPSSRSFTTTAMTTPPPPVLDSPANHALNVGLTPTFTWNASQRAATYRLQVAVDAGFDTLLVNDSTITGTTFVSTQLPNGRAFYWRVNAKNFAGTSAYSAVFTFNTLAPPVGPFLVQPENGAGGVSVAPRFVWSLPDGADSFQLQLAKTVDFSLIVFEKSDLGLTSWDVFGLDGNTRYYWRVRARNNAGIGEWSSVSTFTTTLTGAANWVIPLAVSETGVARDTIYFGIRPGATLGIDPSMGEYELPPPPAPGFFDLRFIDPPSHQQATGEGLRVSYYPFKSYTQVDTFKFSFQTGTGSYPVTVSWPAQYINVLCDSMVLVDDFGGVALHTRMDIASTIVIQNVSITSGTILIYGPKPLPTDIRPPVIEIPSGFVLSQNYPNPFNPTTRLDFSAERSGHIRIEVFDLLGRKISTLADEMYAPGLYTVAWDGRNSDGQTLESGVYFVRMTAIPMGVNGEAGSSYTATRRMLLMK